MRSDYAVEPSGWVSDAALADLIGDDPSDAPSSRRTGHPELGLLGALIVVTIGDVRRGDQDALDWLAGEEVEGPALRLADVAEHLGMEPGALRSLILRAARNGTRARRQMLEPARRNRRCRALG